MLLLISVVTVVANVKIQKILQNDARQRKHKIPSSFFFKLEVFFYIYTVQRTVWCDTEDSTLSFGKTEHSKE